MIKYFCDRCKKEIQEWDLEGLLPDREDFGVRFWMGILKHGVRQDSLKEYLILHRKCAKEYFALLDAVRVSK